MNSRFDTRKSGAPRLHRNGLGLALALLLSLSGPTYVFGAQLDGHTEAVNPSEHVELRYVRTLPAPHERLLNGMYQEGTSQLTWSEDGQRLAAYVRSGLAVKIWSADGLYQFEFPRHARFGPNASLLGFVSGHDQLIISPSANSNDLEEIENVEQCAFSIVDAATGKVIRNVPGPNPGKTFRENMAQHQAISPNQELLAIAYHSYAGDRIDVYETRDWQRVASLHNDPQPGVARQFLAFSRDSTKLAVANGFNKRVEIFEVGTWRLLQSIEPFPEKPPPMNALVLTALAFSPDGSKIAVGAFGGGTWKQSAGDKRTADGPGTSVEKFPRDPLRVYRIDDGGLVASASGFPSGFTDEHTLAWLPGSDVLAFIDARRQLLLWSPLQQTPPTAVLPFKSQPGRLVLSPDGTHLAVNFAEGVKIFEMVPH